MSGQRRSRKSSIEEILVELRRSGAEDDVVACLDRMARGFHCARHPNGQKSLYQGRGSFIVVCEECMQAGRPN